MNHPKINLMVRVISVNDVHQLRAAGWKACDLHVHTTRSHDVIPLASLTPQALYMKAKYLGMDFVTFTDHDNMRAYEDIQRPDIVRGCEIKVHDKRIGHTVHINVYLITDAQFGMLTYFSEQGDLATFLGYCRDEKIPHTLNHPFWTEVGEKATKETIEYLITLFPVIELNMARPRKDNDLVFALATKYGKGIVAATDTHSGNVAEAFTLAPGNTFREYWDNIVAGNSCIVRKDLNMKLITAEVNARISQAFSSDVNNEQLRVFAAGQRRTSTRFAAQALVYTRTVKPVGFLLKHTLLGISNSRVPAVIYVTQSNLRKK
jgi:predicted metal-dependent phosphoesterase TrpH